MATACLNAEHHPVILELLEIPQLMSACVRSGSYDEALDLRAFAAKTALLHPNLEVNTLHVEPPGPGHRHVLHPQLALKDTGLNPQQECCRLSQHPASCAMHILP
jgi:hypothetical protein